MGWIIFFSVLAVFAILLLSSLKITLVIDEKIKLKVNYLFVRFFCFDSTKTEKKVKIRGKKKHNKNKKSIVDSLKAYASAKHKTELIFEIFDYLKIIFSKFKKLLTHTKFEKAFLDLTVATEDAANTALLYGKICSAVYPIITLLDTAMKFDPKEISVKTDFASSQMKLYMSGVIKIRLIHILGFVLSTAFSVILLKLGDLNNGKQSQH